MLAVIPLGEVMGDTIVGRIRRGFDESAELLE